MMKEIVLARTAAVVPRQPTSMTGHVMRVSCMRAACLFDLSIQYRFWVADSEPLRNCFRLQPREEGQMPRRLGPGPSVEHRSITVAARFDILAGRLVRGGSVWCFGGLVKCVPGGTGVGEARVKDRGVGTTLGRWRFGLRCCGLLLSRCGLWRFGRLGRGPGRGLRWRGRPGRSVRRCGEGRIR